MLYNGVELPNIGSVWTDKMAYPNAIIYRRTDDIWALCSSSVKAFWETATDGLLAFERTPHNSKGYRLIDGVWVLDYDITNSAALGIVAKRTVDYVLWANFDVLRENGSLYLAASVPVNPDAPVESPVMDILSTTADSSSIHTDFNVSGISSDSLYTITASCFFGEQVVGSSAVGPYSGPEFQATVSVGGLSPSTEYTVEYQLSKDGEYTGVSQTVTVTTAAASGSGSGDGSGDSGSCACPSILNSILSAITTQTNFLSTWQQTWTTRMDGLESTLSKLIPVPDPTETALKESVKETTTEFTKEFWDAESDNALGSASITESADVLSNTKGLFDIGVSTSDFFGLFGDSSWGHWFSEETRSDLHTVPSVSAVDLYEDEEKSTYEKNLDSIRNFMGG